MPSSETLAPHVQVENYILPTEAEWVDIDAVPQDLRDIVELHMLAMSEGNTIEEVSRRAADLEEIYDVYDGWSGSQRILVARDENGHVCGMLSYYLMSTGVPFAESVAVDPQAQGNEIGSALIEAALEEMRHVSDADHAIAQAQSRVVEIYARRWGAQILSKDNRSGRSKISIPL
jgi:GNAT superfamily N-acetyltransferase